MAALTINFVREIRKKREYAAKKDQRLLRNVAIVAGLLILVSINLLGINWWLGRQVDDVVAQQNATKEAIQDKQQEELAYNYFVQKLKALSALFQDRQGKKEAVSFFRGLFPTEIKIAGLEYSMDEQLLTFAIRSPSVFSLDKVVDQLESESIKQKFPSIEKQGIRRDQDGSYSVGVNVELGQ